MALAIVQHKSAVMGAGIPGGVTLASTPTPGNLIIFFFHCNTIKSLVTKNTTDWTEFEDVSNTNQYGSGLYRYVQIGDTTALPAIWTAGVTYWAYEVYEISGVTGTFASDVPHHNSTFNSGNVTSLASGASLSCTANGSIALIGAGQYNGNVNPTLDVAWTRDEFGANNSNYGSQVSGEQTGVVSGASISVTVTFTANSGPADLVMLIIEPPPTGETGTANMAFSGISMSGAGRHVVTGTGLMGFTGISISGVGIDTRRGTGSMAFTGISIHGSALDVKVKGTAGLAFGGISIHATGVLTHIKGVGAMHFAGIGIRGYGVNESPAGGGLRQFWTF